MTDVIQQFTSKQTRTNLPSLRTGQTVRVHLKIKEKGKERIQIFEGLIIGIRGGKTMHATVTIRKVSHGVGVERVFPLHSPVIDHFEVMKQERFRRAKLYFLRTDTKKRKVKENREALEKIHREQEEQEKVDHQLETKRDSELKAKESEEKSSDSSKNLASKDEAKQ